MFSVFFNYQLIHKNVLVNPYENNLFCNFFNYSPTREFRSKTIFKGHVQEHQLIQISEYINNVNLRIAKRRANAPLYSRKAYATVREK